MRKALLWCAVAALALGGCGGASTTAAYLSPGTYQGTDKTGSEYTLVVAPGKIRLNGAETDVDDTKQQTTFTAIHSPGKPAWTCRPTDNDTAGACEVRTGSALLTIDLMKENE